MVRDVLIIGAGQHGLSLGRLLKTAGISFVILEAQNTVGAKWKEHYDSLVLFTPRSYSSLEGLTMEGNPHTFPTKDEYAEYLQTYARHLDLPIVFNARVHHLKKEGTVFSADTGKTLYQARAVVVAVGNQLPYTPSTDSSILHSSQYKNPESVHGSNILVVGNGNSAVQIALELAHSRKVSIAMHQMPKFIPRTILGKSFYWWRDLFGLTYLSPTSLLGKIFRRDKDDVVGTELLQAIKAKKVTRVPGVKSIEGKHVTFTDDTQQHYDDIVLATGYLPDYSWIEITGALEQKSGVSAVPGLYFAGLRNQVTNVSSSIYGVAKVSHYLFTKIQKYLV